MSPPLPTGRFTDFARSRGYVRNPACKPAGLAGKSALATSTVRRVGICTFPAVAAAGFAATGTAVGGCVGATAAPTVAGGGAAVGLTAAAVGAAVGAAVAAG